MFQIGFGTNPFQAGLMLLIYTAGNVAMKSTTTRILRRWGFRRVITVNGAMCAATLDLVDSHVTWYFVGAVMTVATLISLRLESHASQALAKRR